MTITYVLRTCISTLEYKFTYICEQKLAGRPTVSVHYLLKHLDNQININREFLILVCINDNFLFLPF